jgi:hypothetical protein
MISWRLRLLLLFVSSAAGNLTVPNQELLHLLQRTVPGAPLARGIHMKAARPAIVSHSRFRQAQQFSDCRAFARILQTPTHFL